MRIWDLQGGRAKEIRYFTRILMLYDARYEMLSMLVCPWFGKLDNLLIPQQSTEWVRGPTASAELHLKDSQDP